MEPRVVRPTVVLQDEAVNELWQRVLEARLPSQIFGTALPEVALPDGDFSSLPQVRHGVISPQLLPRSPIPPSAATALGLSPVTHSPAKSLISSLDRTRQALEESRKQQQSPWSPLMEEPVPAATQKPKDASAFMESLQRSILEQQGAQQQQQLQQQKQQQQQQGAESAEEILAKAVAQLLPPSASPPKQQQPAATAGVPLAALSLPGLLGKTNSTEAWSNYLKGTPE
jgi:hypothetical protein